MYKNENRTRIYSAELVGGVYKIIFWEIVVLMAFRYQSMERGHVPPGLF